MLQSMKPDETDNSIDVTNYYCEKYKRESELPDAKTRLWQKIRDDFPHRFALECRSDVRMNIQKAWSGHLESEGREIQRKTQPLKKNIETIRKLLNHQIERT